MAKQKLIIGTRSSDLALWQANFVKRSLEKKFKSLSVELKLIKTKGDKILSTALSKIGDKGLFTKELEIELLKKSVDIAVHSLKDLQTELPEELVLGAVPERHAVEDVLIARKKGITINTLPENAVVATGSLRRRSQLLHLRPDITVVELRGNVPTRIEKFLKSDWDAIILARAGLERLGLKKHISSYIPVEEMLPAVGQGALGIEVHRDNALALEIIASLHDAHCFAAVCAERALLRRLEGGCQVPIGAYARALQSGLYLDAFVGSVDGSVSFRKRIRGSASHASELGEKLAKEFLAAGAGEILSRIVQDSPASLTLGSEVKTP